MKILLIEDDLKLQALIKEYLETYEYKCEAFANPKEVLVEYRNNFKQYSLIILDLGLPDMDGFDLFIKLKEIYDIPIIISTARGDIGNKIHGFELGADDYLAKPYEPRELVLRISLVLKRSLNTRDTYKIADFTINNTTKQVFNNDREIEFTRIEFKIFHFLISHSNQGVTREQIINGLGLNGDTRDRTIDTHIRNIRIKIFDDTEHKYIKSVWGIGYKFVC